VEAGVPIVVGTTGWHQYMDKVVSWSKNVKGAFLYGFNFSNRHELFFKAIQAVARC